MKFFIVFGSLLICFLSLLGVIIVAKTFGFSPEQFRDPLATFYPTTIVTTLSVLLLPIFIIFIVQKLIHRSNFSELGLKQKDYFSLIKFLIIGAIIKGVSLYGAYVISPQSVVEFNINGTLLQSIPYLAWFALTLFLNSLNEELVYRAYPIENLKSSMLSNPILVIIITATIFSAMHFLIEPFHLTRFFYRFFFGTAAGLIYLNRRSLWSIVGLHTGWNFVSLGINDADWRTGAIFKLTGLVENSEMIANIVALLLLTIFLLLKQRFSKKTIGHVFA